MWIGYLRQHLSDVANLLSKLGGGETEKEGELAHKKGKDWKGKKKAKLLLS